ncbi:MAG: LysE family translocator [Pseudomonadota bacterium]
MLTFAVSVFFLLITPGPGVLTTAGVAAAYGFRNGLGYMSGIVIGAQVVMICVASGLAAMVFAIPYVRVTLLVASVAYLFYLAFVIAMSGNRIGFISVDKSPKFWQGFALSVINPKAYAVSTTLFSGFAFWPENLAVENTLKCLIVLSIAIPIHLIWLYAGAALKKLELSPRTARLINFAMAGALVAVVALALMSQFSASASPP